MSHVALTILMSGTLVAVSGAPLEHRTRLDHVSGPAEAHYRADVAVKHRQVGTTAPGGRPSTLSCRWSAGLVVEREARGASGSMLARTIDRERVIEGRRPGWCSAQTEAIRKEIARRSGELRDHVVAVAEEDHTVLRAELDRSYAARRTG